MICADEYGSRLLKCTGCCDHIACSLCYYRIRLIGKDFHCPICKTNLEHVVSDNQLRSFNDYNIWGDNIGPGYYYDSRSRMFFPKSYFLEVIKPLIQCKCNICGNICNDLKHLRNHVNCEHNQRMCLLCIENKQSFPVEHKVFSIAKYDTHLRSGDGDGSSGHPNCEFCNRRFYDQTGLFIHLQKEHYTCHICDREGRRFKYYLDYNSLDNHFTEEHFVCKEPECLLKRFIVFSNQIELTSHMISIHPNIATKRTIPISFKVTRSSTQYDSNDYQDRDGDYNTSFTGDGTSSRSRNRVYDAGISGRVNATGEWQIGFPPLETADPRALTRNGHVSSSGTSTEATSTHMSGGVRGSGIMYSSAASNLSAIDSLAQYPTLPTNGIVGGSVLTTSSTSKSKSKNKNTNKSFTAKVNSTNISFRDVIEPPPTLAMRLHSGEVLPTSATATHSTGNVSVSANMSSATAPPTPGLPASSSGNISHSQKTAKPKSATSLHTDWGIAPSANDSPSSSSSKHKKNIGKSGGISVMKLKKNSTDSKTSVTAGSGSGGRTEEVEDPFANYRLLVPDKEEVRVVGKSNQATQLKSQIPPPPPPPPPGFRSLEEYPTLRHTTPAVPSPPPSTLQNTTSFTSERHMISHTTMQQIQYRDKDFPILSSVGSSLKTVINTKQSTSSTSAAGHHSSITSNTSTTNSIGTGDTNLVENKNKKNKAKVKNELLNLAFKFS